MKIISLQAENVKKLVAVEIRPDGNLVQITGKNGNGKTSVLDAIWWAIAGAKNIQSAPIRNGANSAKIRLDLGDIVVTRTFERPAEAEGIVGAEIVTKIVVENADGARFPSPQKMLDGLLGALSFDPLAFSRMDPKAQFDTLKAFVPGVDFAAIEAANKADYITRTDVNRRAKEARTLGNQIVIPEETPEVLVDETELIGELERAGQHNADIETRKANRASAMERIEGAKIQAEDLIQRRDRIHSEALTEIDRIKRDAAARITEVEGRAKGQSTEMHDQHTKLITSIAELLEKLDTAAPLPEPIDIATVRASIDAAKETNRLVGLRLQRTDHMETATTLEAESTALTKAMEARDLEKQKAIAAAELPVENITFGDGVLLMDGVPFDQASDAQQLRASISIAMASNPKLRVIRVRDGSLLDEDAMKLLTEMIADKKDPATGKVIEGYQVWIERVEETGKVGFVLEDGRLKVHQQQQAAE